MAYASSTDFLALLRLTGGGVRTERMPGLDWMIEAFARAGLVSLFVGQSPPIVSQSTTAWFKPAVPSWGSEGVLFLWNPVTVQYEAATPALWSLFISQQPNPATVVPLMDATPGLVGTSLLYARQDHVHPTDTTRAPLNSPGFTGTPTAPTPTLGDATTKIATTEFVSLNGGFPFPVGGVIPLASTTLPSANWAVANGAAVSRTGATAGLFALLGIVFGSGDGVTTFNLPDLRGRVVAGVDGGINRLTTATMSTQALGGIGGGETYALNNANQLPAHAHGVTDPGHNHGINFTNTNNTVGSQNYLLQGSTVGANSTNFCQVAFTGITTQNNGSSVGHPNVQPTIELNYIIRIS